MIFTTTIVYWKMVINFQNHVTANQVLCMDCAKFIKVQLIMITYLHSVQYCMQLVLVITTLQNFLYQYWSFLFEYTVKDSFSFYKEILDQDLNLFMTSFDIQSLSTNVSLDETIIICDDRVFEMRKKVKGMLKYHFK